MALRHCHCLAGLPPSDPLQPLHKRHRPDIGGKYISHSEIQIILTIATKSNVLEFPLTHSSSLGWGFHGTPFTTTLWVPWTPMFIISHATSSSHLVRANPFDFTWLLDHVSNFYSIFSRTAAQSTPFSSIPFTFGMPII